MGISPFNSKFYSSIYKKFFLIGLVIILITYAVLSFSGYYFLMNIQGEERVTNKLNVTKTLINDEINHLTLAAGDLAKIGQPKASPCGFNSPKYVETVEHLTNFDILFFVDKVGHTLYIKNKSGLQAPVQFENNIAVKQALRGKATSGFVILGKNEIAANISENTIALIAAAPSYSKGKLIGVAGAINVLSLNKSLASSIKDKIISDFILAAHKKVILNTNRGYSQFATGSTLPISIAKTLDTRSPVYFGKEKASGRLVGFEPINDLTGQYIGALGVLIDMKPVAKLNTQLQSNMLAIALLLVVLMLGLYWWLTKSIFRRVYALQEGIKNIMRNDLTYLDDTQSILCWELNNCHKTDCPAYENFSVKCWLLQGTLCDCQVQGGMLKELGNKCKKCPVYKTQKSDEVLDLVAIINLLIFRITASKKDIQKANEELTAKNEELFSQQEELVSQQEELFAINEELAASNHEVNEVNETLRNALKDVSNSEEVIYSLAKAVEAKDPYTQGHSERVAEYAQCIARKIGFTEEGIKIIYSSAILHDIGKIGVSDTILNKPSCLEEEEFNIIKQHSEIGEKILSNLTFAQKYLPNIRYHHEWFNGQGYPEGLMGEKIPIGARILAVVDAFDAMTSDRPYRLGMNPDKAVEILREGAGKQWDGKVVEVFLSCWKGHLSFEN